MSWRVLVSLISSFLMFSCSSNGVTVRSADVEGFETARQAVQQATIVVIGTPREQAEILKVLPDGATADYKQEVVVDTVIFGPEVSSLFVVRAGPVGADSQSGEFLEGPLDPTRQAFLLQPSGESGAYSVVGHSQGGHGF